MTSREPMRTLFHARTPEPPGPGTRSDREARATGRAVGDPEFGAVRAVIRVEEHACSNPDESRGIRRVRSRADIGQQGRVAPVSDPELPPAGIRVGRDQHARRVEHRERLGRRGPGQGSEIEDLPSARRLVPDAVLATDARVRDEVHEAAVGDQRGRARVDLVEAGD